MASDKDKKKKKRPYVKPLLIIHGSLTFLATQAGTALATLP
ncbi:MAG TPA: hypothetical protein VNK24_07720 [Elusimicrobiota bacterium]|nr:hypothetical protein [Elusimicrobiota bacterium]